MNQLTVLDLFSGIGGFSYGLEATGLFHTQCFVEINPFCQRVLKKHWPSVPCYPDIREIKGSSKQFDVICGGFPCQNVSVAAATHSELSSLLGDQSGLWWEHHRLIREILPTWVLIENVDQLRKQGLSIIISQLAALGYDAEWNTIRAGDVGLPHSRRRVWVVAHAISERLEGNCPFPLPRLRGLSGGKNHGSFTLFRERSSLPGSGLCRGYNGIPSGVDRIKALGNAVVPQIPFELGMAIREYYAI